MVSPAEMKRRLKFAFMMIGIFLMISGADVAFGWPGIMIVLGYLWFDFGKFIRDSA